MSNEHLDCKIRVFLQKNEFRDFTASIFFVLSASILIVLYYYFGAISQEFIRNSLIIGASISVVLSTLAYNLRVKIVEYVLKAIEKSREPDFLIDRTYSNNKCLTNLSLAGFIVGLISAIVRFSNCESMAVPIICIGLVVFCVVEYVFLLFAFEKIEIAILKQIRDDEMKKRAREALEMFEKK